MPVASALLAGGGASSSAAAAAAASGRRPRRAAAAAHPIGRAAAAAAAVATSPSLSPSPSPRRRALPHRRSPLSSIAASSNLDLSALEVPDIDADVLSHQAALGAAFDDEGAFAVTFDNTPQVLAALRSGAALCDRSHACSRVRVAGPGALEFLHGQTTADVRRVLGGSPGTGCEAVVVTPQARCLDLLTVLRTGDESFLLLGSGGEAGAALLARLQKFVFKGDQVAVMDVSGPTRVFSLLGPRAAAVLRELGGDAAAPVAVEEPRPEDGEEVRPGAPPRKKNYVPAPFGAHVTLSFRGAPVLVASGSGLASPGFTLLADESVAADLYAALALPRPPPADGSGGSTAKEQPPLTTPMGEADWQRARVTQGRPAAGAELTADTNPLEAGLYHAVSVAKGCYVGQEALAKMASVGAAGPRRQLWGVQLSAAASPGDLLYAADERAARAAGLGGEGEEEVEAGRGAAGAGEEASGGGGGGGGGGPSSSAQKPQPLSERKPIGVLTSTVDLLDNGHFGLALLRCRASGGKGKGAATLPLEGLALRLRSPESGPPARVVDVPYASRVFAEGCGPKDEAATAAEAAAATGSMADREAAALEAKAKAKEEADRARAEKLAQAQAKIDAWKRQQQQQKKG